MDYSVGQGPTARNPYAWIDWLNSTDEFNEQSVTLLLHRAVAGASGVFGGIFCLFMLYLVVFETKGPLRNYRKMMLMSTIADIEFWAVNTFVQELIIVRDKVCIVAVDGPGRVLSYDAQMMIMAAVISTLSHVVTILPVQFYYRYKCVAALIPPSTRHTVFLFILSVLPLTVLDSMVYHSFVIGGTNQPGRNFAHLWFDEYPLHSLLVLDFTHIFVRIYIVILTIVYAGSYALALVFFHLTVKKMDADRSALRRETVKLQRQLSVYMFIQAAIPLVITVGPMLVVCVGLFFSINMSTSLLSLSMLVATIPIFNPLQTVLVISPFRRRVKAIFGIESVSKSNFSNAVDGHAARSRTEHSKV